MFAYLYRKTCVKALIPLTRGEKTILDQLTDEDGWVDVETYKLAASKYMTSNQVKILTWLPTQKDDPFLAGEKNRQCQIMVEKMRKRNA